MNHNSSAPQGLDPRTNAVRPGMAAEHLRELVQADRYVSGRQARVTAGLASLHKGAGHDMPVVSQLVYGDDVTIYDESGNWSWVQNNRDGYVGYVPTGILSGDMRQPTHRITALSTFAYGRADIKTPLPYKLYMNSRLQVVGELENYWQLADGRFVYKWHAAPLEDVADDFVSVAERFGEAPYLWGGCTADGIDCSGLVQAAFECAGLSCPRDSDMQMDLEGRDLDLGGMEDLQRGDLLFWKGHVAIMLDDTMMLHANAHYMKVSTEMFHAAVGRIASTGGGDLIAIKRPARLSAGE